MDIDFTRLKYFVAVADELHFKRAADRLMITAPPLSRQIMLLEREVGGALFERGYHEVRLTPLGAHLLDRARAIVQKGAEFRVAAQAFTAEETNLRVGVTAYAPSDFLERFQTVVGELSVPISCDITGSAADVTTKLMAGELDVGLVQFAGIDTRLRSHVVAEYQGGIAVRADDPLAAKDSIRITELRDREVVVDLARPNPTALAGLTRSLQRAGIDRIVRVATHGGEIEVAQQVFHRRLVAILTYAPDSFLGRLFAPPQFKLVPIDTDRWRPMSVALAWTADGARRRPAVERAIEEIVAKLG
ncbi:LysR family transcriptional regulator [Nocardia sp. SSK8]|uniref:LysR family transcriptional regulator n=1 Tax=Nocardia sp. SSK8 TaxID=3120154 RepID=UPI0030095528